MAHLGAPTMRATAPASMTFQGVALRPRPGAAFVAAARPAGTRQRHERTLRSGQCQAVFVAEQRQVRSRTRTVDGPTARVTFKVRRQLPFGQVLKLVGGHFTLGEWDCTDAPVMTWSEGDLWLLQLDLPAGEHEFKVAAVAPPADSSAVAEETVLEWEAGPNRLLQVPSAEAKAGGAFSIVMEWGNPDATWLEGKVDAPANGNGSKWAAMGSQNNEHNGNGHHDSHGDGHNGNGGTALHVGAHGTHHAWTIEDERNARRAVEAERDQLRGERDSLAHQLRHAQEQLSAALAEKAQLEGAAARAQHNIDVLRNVGQLLRTMHTD